MDLHEAFDSVDHDVLPDRYSPGKNSHLEVELQGCSLIKKERKRRFPMNLEKFLRTPFLTKQF